MHDKRGGAEIFLKQGRKRDSREIIQHNLKGEVMKKTQTVHECRRSFEPTRNRVKIERGEGRVRRGASAEGKGGTKWCREEGGGCTRRSLNG